MGRLETGCDWVPIYWQVTPPPRGMKAFNRQKGPVLHPAHGARRVDDAHAQAGREVLDQPAHGCCPHDPDPSSNQIWKICSIHYAKIQVL